MTLSLAIGKSMGVRTFVSTKGIRLAFRRVRRNQILCRLYILAPVLETNRWI
jgi:hypothetical protein